MESAAGDQQSLGISRKSTVLGCTYSRLVSDMPDQPRSAVRLGHGAYSNHAWRRKRGKFLMMPSLVDQRHRAKDDFRD